ncbi:hypothetical protein [Amphibacillus cookii]|uniref:hypothetical protein n=1 Tax=Amphibacillus cookii TaxID=767787 RepID=UPI00195F1942|nr:hypothetical protein [Amphibacillus cookii]MBM7541270.1 hypothetical protein [Amphibacillus cookii]
MFRSFGEKQSGLQKWLGNRQVHPAFAGNVLDVPMRVMDSGHINKKLDGLSRVKYQIQSIQSIA